MYSPIYPCFSNRKIFCLPVDHKDCFNDFIILGEMGSSLNNCWPRQCAAANGVPTKFKRPFENTPTVIVGFGKLDVDNRANLRVTSEAEDVTKVGFTLKFATWANTKVWGYKLVWIACD